MDLLDFLDETAAIYYAEKSSDADGQQLDGWPVYPDLAAEPCMLVQGGKDFQESPVGMLIDSQALLYTATEACREGALVVVGERYWMVNGTPITFAKFGITLQVTGLKEQRSQP